MIVLDIVVLFRQRIEQAKHKRPEQNCGFDNVEIAPKLAGFVLSAFQNGPSANGAFGGPIHDDELDRLSNREQEVMRLIARGYTYKEVASELFISIKTVETHMSSVLRKLQLSNRSELTRWAADRRIV